MKKRNIWLITFMLTAAVVFFAGCGADTPSDGNQTNPDSASSGKESDSGECMTGEQALDMIGGGLDFVQEENRLGYLLDRYENLHIVTQFSDGTEEQSVCFLFGGQPAWAMVEYEETSKRVLSGSLGALDFYCEPGVVQAQLDMELYESGGSYLDYMISSYISAEAQVETVEDLDPYLRVTAVNGNPEDPEARRDIYILEKGTLRLVEVSYLNENGVRVGGQSIDTGWDEGGLISNFLTAWEEIRTVSFVYDKMLADGNIAASKVSVEVPATWEVLPRYPEETYCYMERNLTRPYVYPGDGTEDYTVYVTNTAG